MQFKFVYVWRLDREKGLEDICFAFEKLLQEWKFDIYLDLFWQEGNCSELVRSLVQKYPAYISYHGRQPKSVIAEYRNNCHYVLMPSHFLETFGLACLDAYRYGKPVIGYQKWWLQELIINDFAISARQDRQTDVDWLYNKIVEILQIFHSEIYTQQSLKCKEIYSSYSEEWWKERVEVIMDDFQGDCHAPLRCARNDQGTQIRSFDKLTIRNKSTIDWNNQSDQSEQNKSLLLVSDYLHRFWGIEAFLYESKVSLEQLWYAVDMCWSTMSQTWKRYLGLPYSWCNISMAIHLWIQLLRKQYTCIRFHSIQRYIGWLPIYLSTYFPIPKLFMLHDVWLLHPYPSLVTREDQLDFPRTLASYVSAGKQVGKNSLFDILSMILKFGSSSVFRFLLMKFNLLLVPSAYLKPILERRIDNSSVKVRILPHFVSK
jgi:hypothetical protein